MAETAVEQAPAAPQAAEAPASSSLQPPTQDLNARIAAAKSPAEIRRLTEENRAVMEAAVDKARKTPHMEIPPDLKAAAEAEAREKAKAEEAAPTEEAPAAEETPATEPEAAPEAAPETPADEAEDGDTPLEPITGDRVRLKFAEGDKVGRLAASILKRNRDLTMEESILRAKKQLGIKDPEATPAAPKSDLPETVEATDAMLDKLDADREKALTDLRFEEVAKIDRQLRKLDRHRLGLERASERSAAEQAAAYDREFNAAVAKAADMYPDSTNPESEFGKRMLEIERELKDADDPLYSSPNKALKIAQMVAAERNIAPKRKGAPPAPAKPAVPAVAPKKQVLPAGGSKTTVAVTPQKPAIDSRVSEVKGVKDLRALQAQLGIGGFRSSVGR